MFQEGSVGLGRGPNNDDDAFFFLLILNVLGRGPSNDNEGISVSADFAIFFELFVEM